ncbi:hypothetical protein JCM30204_01270 [Dysgonomonas termitidis]
MINFENKYFIVDKINKLFIVSSSNYMFDILSDYKISPVLMYYILFGKKLPMPYNKLFGNN